MFTLSDYLIRLLATLALLTIFAYGVSTGVESLKARLNEAAHAGEVRR
jgi:hypothetical protein